MRVIFKGSVPVKKLKPVTLVKTLLGESDDDVEQKKNNFSLDLGHGTT